MALSFIKYGLLHRHFIGDEGWSIQPQVQVAHVHVFSENYTTQRQTSVKVKDTDIVQFRAGLEGGKNIKTPEGAIFYPYGRVSVINQQSWGGAIETDTLSWTPGLTGTNLEYGAGLIYQMDAQRQGYVTVVASQGNHYDMPWGVNVGFRYEF